MDSEPSWSHDGSFNTDGQVCPAHGRAVSLLDRFRFGPNARFSGWCRFPGSARLGLGVVTGRWGWSVRVGARPRLRSRSGPGVRLPRLFLGGLSCRLDVFRFVGVDPDAGLESFFSLRLEQLGRYDRADLSWMAGAGKRAKLVHHVPEPARSAFVGLSLSYPIFQCSRSLARFLSEPAGPSGRSRLLGTSFALFRPIISRGLFRRGNGLGYRSLDCRRGRLSGTLSLVWHKQRYRTDLARLLFGSCLMR